MADSVYKVIELVGTSKDSWEQAAKNAVDTEVKHLRIYELQKLRNWT